MEHLKIWEQAARPPKEALRTIQAGRLKGKSDINPQWRMKAMTEIFGPVGGGWKYEIVRLWNEPASAGQVFAFAEVSIYYKLDGEWSAPVPGIGGSMLVVQEKSGMHSSDEGYKMAVTDALSVAMKALGVAADVYMGLFDGSKYAQQAPAQAPQEAISDKQVSDLTDMVLDAGADEGKFLEYMGVKSLADIPGNQYNKAVAALQAKKNKGAA